jgi:hypothetical protein
MIYREDEALPLLEKASQSSQIGTDAHLELSVLYERRHRLDEALDQVQQFLHDDPSNPEATLLKARIHRRAGDTTQAAQIYEELSTRNGCLPNTKAEAINEWANLLDSQHDYPAALEKLLESKQILIGLPETETAKKRSEQEHVWLHHLTDSVTPAHFENWSERESPNTPESVLLTGCPRSGTTLIEKKPIHHLPHPCLSKATARKPHPLCPTRPTGHCHLLLFQMAPRQHHKRPLSDTRRYLPTHRRGTRRLDQTPGNATGKQLA